MNASVPPSFTSNIKIMKRETSPSVMLTATLLAFACGSIQNVRAASLVTSVNVGASNDPGTLIPFGPGASDYSGTGGQISAIGSASFIGLDSNNVESTMSFSGSATASAAYGMLRTAASGSASGVYYNGENAPYYDSEVGVNPNGSPSFLASFGQAQFIDTLNYGNVPAGFRTDFYFHITGSFTGTSLVHSVYVEFGTQSDFIILYPDSGGVINQVWVTDKFNPLPGVDIDFRTTVLSQFNLYPEFATEGGSYTGSANFMNTVTLAGMNVFDEDDNLITGWTVTSGSGTMYPVPEPSVTLLGLAGAVGFVARRRRE
jgi:hypothetical protein